MLFYNYVVSNNKQTLLVRFFFKNIFIPGQNLQHSSGTENCSDGGHSKTGHWVSTSTFSHFTTPFKQTQVKHGSKFIEEPCSNTISPLVWHGSGKMVYNKFKYQVVIFFFFLLFL